MYKEGIINLYKNNTMYKDGTHDNKSMKNEWRQKGTEYLILLNLFYLIVIIILNAFLFLVRKRSVEYEW